MFRYANRPVDFFQMMLVIFAAVLMTGHVLAESTCPEIPECNCYNETLVNCDGKHLTKIPAAIPSTVESLFFRNNRLRHVTTNTLYWLIELESLWLNNNSVVSIEPFSFKNITKLKQIDFRANQIQRVGPYAFAGLPHLESILLWNNKIQYINEKAFDGAKSLKHINLSFNKLTAIPALGRLPSLEMLGLYVNDITDATFPLSYRHSRNLQNITLSKNSISSLNGDTFKSLTDLSLSNLLLIQNHLNETTVDAFRHFKSIATLRIGRNPFGMGVLETTVKSLLGKHLLALDLSSLTNFDSAILYNITLILKRTMVTDLIVKGNSIPVLPSKVFYGMDKLLLLDLSKCQIHRTQTDSFNGLPKLKELDLQNNKLTYVPHNLPTTLQYLHLDNNQISTLCDLSFSKLHHLKELTISKGGVTTLMQDSFHGLHNLQKLDLSSNLIHILPGRLFGSLHMLKKLNLAANDLKYIQHSPSRFANLTSLIHLDLSDNHCYFISKDFFNDLSTLQHLLLQGNNLSSVISSDEEGNVFRHLVKLTKLDLMQNEVTHLPDALLQEQKHLKFLSFQGNKITGWGKDLFKSTKHLQVLDMSDNLISSLTIDILQELPTSLISLDIAGNPFSCDCNLRDFRDWIKKTPIKLEFAKTYACNTPVDWKNKPVLSFDRKKINCLFFTWWEIMISCGIATAVVLVIVSIIYRKRWWIKLFIYKRTRARKMRKLKAADDHGNYGAIDKEDDTKTYDAYVSCSPDDSIWVIDNLLPGIDNGQMEEDHRFGGRFSLYLEERDSEPGKYFQTNGHYLSYHILLAMCESCFRCSI